MTNTRFSGFAWKSWAASLLLVAGTTGACATECSGLLNREMSRLQDEKPQNLCQYAGKVVVVVNTASYCGFTAQYKGLEALYARHRERGLVVLGFPSNDFGGQEPGNNQEIASFCANTFGVKFPMFTKTRVSQASGAALSPLYAELRQRTGTSPRWNFHKYLIARDGSTVQSFGSNVEPDDKSFVESVEKLLAAQ
jgi:glutathione peroxidase